MSALFTSSCTDCGWTGHASSQAFADFAYRQHSCQRQRDRVARAERYAARMAAIDRTPKTCPHTRAGHTHGTYAAYTFDGCRCRPCVDVAVAYDRRRRQQTAYGRWQPYVDATPVREHVQALTAAGLGLKRIRVLSGVSQGALGKLMYGERKPDGSLRPSTRVRPETAAKILAVEFSPDLLAPGVNVDATGTRRRLQALVAIGWSQSKLARRMGMLPSNFAQTMHAPRVYNLTARAARTLYEELWESPPPERNKYERYSASRARRFAANQGWLPPAWWDEDTIENPAYAPVTAEPEDDEPPRVGRPVGSQLVDEVAVQRRAGGDRSTRLSRAERWHLVRHLHADGLNDQQIARRTGYSDRQILRDRHDLGLAAIDQAVSV